MSRILDQRSGAITGTTSTDGPSDWRERAACLDHDPEDWFPEGVTGYSLAGPAFNTCHTCPVQAACLAWALEFEGSVPVNCRAGIYGGTTPNERHRRYRERAAQRSTAA